MRDPKVGKTEVGGLVILVGRDLHGSSDEGIATRFSILRPFHRRLDAVTYSRGTSECIELYAKALGHHDVAKKTTIPRQGVSKM